jgi:hypothetical protein
MPAPELDSPEYRGFRHFVQLTLEKRELAARLKEVENELRSLEPQLLQYLGEGGYQSVQLEGYRLAPYRDPWVYPAEGVTREEVCSALERAGWGHFVKPNYSTRSLTTYVRELEEHQQLVGEHAPLLPAELTGVLVVKPSYRLQITKHK